MAWSPDSRLLCLPLIVTSLEPRKQLLSLQMVKRKYKKFHDSKGLQEVSQALRAKLGADILLEPTQPFTGLSGQQGYPGQEPSAQPFHSPRAKLRAVETQSQQQLQGHRTATGSKQLQDAFEARAQRLSQTTELDKFAITQRSRLDSRCALAASELVQFKLKPMRASFTCCSKAMQTLKQSINQSIS